MLRVLYLLDRFGVSDKFYQELSMLFSELPRCNAVKKKARTELNDTMELICIEGTYQPFESTLCKHLAILVNIANNEYTIYYNIHNKTSITFKERHKKEC